MADEVLVATPEWTEFRKKTGLDPLGMQNSSVRLYQSLVPGISNVTLRVRYYGLYAWLSQAYAKTVGDTDLRSWQQFIRRAEALYALVAAVRGGESGVAGANWAERKVYESDGNAIAFAEDAEPGSPTHYLKQAWGAYGAAYASQLFAIGVFSHGATHDIPVPSKELGESLANAFGDSIGDAGDQFLAVMKKGRVSRVVLEALAVMAPSEISLTGKERNVYQQILFATAGLERLEDVERKRTLLLLLQISDLAEGQRNADTVRWALYAQHSGGTAWHPSTLLERHCKRWRLYHANDLSHIACEAMLKFILDRLETHSGGILLDQLLSDAASDVLSSMDGAPRSWMEFTEALELAGDASDASAAASEWSMSRVLMDKMRRGAVYDPETCVVALRLLAMVHKRVGSMRDLIQVEFGGFDQDGFRTLLTELSFLEAHSSLSMGHLLRKFFEERIVRRHLWVALRKLRYQNDYTFLIDSDEGFVRFRQPDGPVWTTPRLSTSLSFLKDIGLLAENGLTPRGRSVLEAA